MNHACILKLGWNLHTDNNDLWSAVLQREVWLWCQQHDFERETDLLKFLEEYCQALPQD